jgi:hypothetical protein
VVDGAFEAVRVAGDELRVSDEGQREQAGRGRAAVGAVERRTHPPAKVTAAAVTPVVVVTTSSLSVRSASSRRRRSSYAGQALAVGIWFRGADQTLRGGDDGRVEASSTGSSITPAGSNCDPAPQP